MRKSDLQRIRGRNVMLLAHCATFVESKISRDYFINSIKGAMFMSKLIKLFLSFAIAEELIAKYKEEKAKAAK